MLEPPLASDPRTRVRPRPPVAALSAMVAACGLGLLVATVATLVMPAPARAEQFARIENQLPWTRFPVDARGEAMGLATTVDPRGATAFWWNPAPLPEGDRVDVSYTSWETHVDDIQWRPVAARASRGDLTVGLVWGPFHVGPMVVRTAYEPDGGGRTVEYTDHLLQLGASWNVAPRLAGGTSAWQWTVGGNLRHVRLRTFDADWQEATTSLWDGDLGTSLRAPLLRRGELTLHGHATAMVRNLARGRTTIEEATVQLPRYYHLGVGLELAAGASWRGAPLVAAAVSHVWHRYDSEHLGLEVTLAGLASLRAGHRTGGVVDHDGWSWGAGLQYESTWWRNLRASVDYARVDMDLALLGEVTQDHWTASVGFDLPSR